MTHHKQSMFLPAILVTVSGVFWAGLYARDEPGKDKEEEARREQQLKMMKRSTAQHTISPVDDRKHLFKFHDIAVLRLSNPLGGLSDGAGFIWTDRGRPQAIIKLY